MAAFSMSTTVQAPIETVFRLAADFPNAAERVKGIKRVEMLTPGPVGVGTRFKETREMMKREATEEMEVTQFVEPKLYTLSCHSCGCLFESTIRCEPDAGGTKLTFDCNTKPLTWGAKLMWPLGWLMQGTVKKCIEQDMADIKAAAEAAAKA
jgi:hypothetical protein